MVRAHRLLVLLLACGRTGAVPAGAVAGPATSARIATQAEQAANPTADGDAGASTDDGTDPAIGDPSAGDSSCPAGDAASSRAASDEPEATADDSADEDDGDSEDVQPADEPAADDVPATCDEPVDDAATTAGPQPLVVRLGRALRGQHLILGRIAVRGTGVITERLTLAPNTATRSLRAYRTATLATGRLSVASARTVQVPLTLTRAGRTVLRKAGKDVRVVLRVSVRMRSGVRSTQSKTLVLRRSAPR